MELPNANHRQTYVDLIEKLERELTAATQNGDNISDLTLHNLQQKLDEIADKYQDDDKIGSAQYKLYELQAVLHHFDHQDDQALAFIDQAIEIKGGSYPSAEKLKAALSSKPQSSPATKKPDETKLTKAEKRKRLIGLEGWLALFIVGQFIAIAVSLYHFFADGFLSSSDISTLNEYQAGLGDLLQVLTAFENVMIVIYIGLLVATIIQLFRRHKSAKILAIIGLAFAAVYGIIDYAAASSLFSSSDIFQSAAIDAFMEDYASTVGKNVVVAAIWIPYFLVSKRVKATLTR